MTILHLAGGSETSGAVISAKRLLLAQHRIYGTKQKYFNPLNIPNNPMRHRFSLLVRKIERKLYHFLSFSKKPTSTNLLPTPNFIRKEITQASLIHIHWCGAGLISVFSLKAIKSPVVVTMHDYWFINGTAHLSKEPSRGFLSNYVRKIKISFLQQNNVAIIAPSTFMLEKLKSLPELANKQHVYRIPNITGQENADLVSRNESNRKMRLLFIANRINDPNKNLSYLLTLAESPKVKAKFEFGIVGHGKISHPNKEGPCVNFLGPFKTTQMNKLISNYDAVIIVSKEETFALTAYEAISIGKYVISSRNGGLNELIDAGIISTLDIINPKKSIEQMLVFHDSWSRGVPQSKLGQEYHDDAICEAHMHVYDQLSRLM